MNVLPYIQITRPRHWFKNVFVIPGFLLAFFFDPRLLTGRCCLKILLGLACACIIASSNYVLNEILDAEYDRHHPEKKHRPIAAGKADAKIAYCLWIFLGLAGIALSLFVSLRFAVAALLFWVMAILYNTPPIRLKDTPYADVLSEAVNNPAPAYCALLLLNGVSPPPLSIILAYWMFGCFLMAVKRFAEYRHINDPHIAGRYRAPFSYYTEERLLLSILFYAAFFGMMSGVFITRYRLELVLASPLIAYTMAYYLHIGFKPNSPAQKPETLLQQKKLVVLVFLTFVTCIVLLFYDITFFREALIPKILPF